MLSTAKARILIRWLAVPQGPPGVSPAYISHRIGILFFVASTDRRLPMGKNPAFLFYANDWLSSTKIAQMTAEQERGYLRLLCHMWNDPDCGLPDDDAVLARLSLVEAEWEFASVLLRGCFKQHPTKKGQITNPRLYELWENRQKKADAGRLGGVKSGEARRCDAKQTRSKREAKGEANANLSVSVSDSVSYCQSDRGNEIGDELATQCGYEGNDGQLFYKTGAIIAAGTIKREWANVAANGVSGAKKSHVGYFRTKLDETCGKNGVDYEAELKRCRGPFPKHPRKTKPADAAAGLAAEGMKKA